MKQYNKYLMIIFTFNLLFGVDKAGTTAAKFLSIGVGSKAVGMGGSYTSIADDATAMYWNPAGLSFHQTKEVYFNHSNWIADISFDYSGITIPIDNKSSLGFNITSVTMDEMEVTRYGNENTGETFSAADFAFGSTYSMSSTGITAGTMGHLDSPALDNSSVLTGVAATHGTGSYTQTTAGAATSFSESFIQGDAVVTTASVSSGVVSSLPVTGDTITYSGGSSSGQSIGITSVAGGTITLSPGAAGSSVTGSITSSIEIE